MMCERCHSKEATVHLTEIIKSVRSEVHLCESCAREIGFNSKISDITAYVSTLDLSDDDIQICPQCGTDVLEVSENGRAGCPLCYNVFEDMFTTVSGDLPYAGKYPANQSRVTCKVSRPAKRRDSDSIEILRRNLEDAVLDERYEEAAKIRDIIREREGSLSI